MASDGMEGNFKDNDNIGINSFISSDLFSSSIIYEDPRRLTRFIISYSKQKMAHKG
jgi:hypothetical protein